MGNMSIREIAWTIAYESELITPVSDACVSRCKQCMHLFILVVSCYKFDSGRFRLVQLQ